MPCFALLCLSSPRRECRPLHAKTGKAKAPRRYRPVARLLKELAARSWPREARCKCEAAGQGGRRAGWSRMSLAASALLLRPGQARPDELTALHPLRLRCHPSTVPCRDHGSIREDTVRPPHTRLVYTSEKRSNLLRSRASTFKSGGAFYSPRAPKESEKSPIPNKKKRKGADAPPLPCLCLHDRPRIRIKPQLQRRAPRLHRSPARPTRSFPLPPARGAGWGSWSPRRRRSPQVPLVT